MMGTDPIAAARMEAIVNAAKARKAEAEKAQTEEEIHSAAVWNAAFDDPEGPQGDQQIWQ